MLSVESQEAASVGSGDQSSTAPRAGDAIRTDAAHSRPSALDGPRLAFWRPRHEAVVLRRVELPVAIRRQRRSATHDETDAQRTIAGADRAARGRPLDAPAARGHDPPRTRR